MASGRENTREDGGLNNMRYTDDGILEYEPSDETLIHDDGYIFTIAKANRLLREEQLKWPVIYGQLELRDHVWNTKNPEWHDTHVSRLMPPRPIQKDSFEQLARDIWKSVPTDRLLPDEKTFCDLVDRARKLLGGEKK